MDFARNCEGTEQLRIQISENAHVEVQPDDPGSRRNSGGQPRPSCLGIHIPR